MSKNILYDIDFGHIDAEADPNLIKYFIETESYRRILQGRKLYVVGRKGTGKSAIYITLSALIHSSLSISGLTFNDYPWKLHNKVRDESKSEDFSHVNTWKYLILIELSKLVLKEQRIADDKILKEIADYLKIIYGSLSPSFKEYLVDKLSRFKSIDLPKVSWKGLSGGGIAFEDKSKPEERLMMSINIVNSMLQEKVFSLLSGDISYFILFDKLDDGWDNSNSSKASLIGLLRASRDISLDSAKAGKFVRCIPFLRSDIYDCLQYNDKNKAFPDIEFLNWDENALLTIINKRISNSLGCEEMDAWDLIFDKKVLARGTSSFSYMVKRTLLRPRDMIQFCDNCKNVTLSKKKNSISGNEIYDAEKIYSDFIYREFVDEAHKQYPFIENLFEVLRCLRYERFNYQEFNTEFNKISAVRKYDNPVQ